MGPRLASSTYDVQFRLFDAAAAGVQQGRTNCYDGVTDWPTA